jgi:hypothetical protein
VIANKRVKKIHPSSIFEFEVDIFSVSVKFLLVFDSAVVFGSGPLGTHYHISLLRP